MTGTRSWLVKLSLNALLFASALWAASGDFCLIENAPKSSVIGTGTVIFATIIQLLALGAIYTSINLKRGYFGAVASWVHDKGLKAALFLIPFLYLMGSHQLIAYAVYGTSSDDKLQIAKSIDLAQRRCHASCWWPAACL